MATSRISTPQRKPGDMLSTISLSSELARRPRFRAVGDDIGARAYITTRWKTARR